jgi:hypothetical protein
MKKVIQSVEKSGPPRIDFDYLRSIQTLIALGSHVCAEFNWMKVSLSQKSGWLRRLLVSLEQHAIDHVATTSLRHSSREIAFEELCAAASYVIYHNTLQQEFASDSLAPSDDVLEETQKCYEELKKIDAILNFQDAEFLIDRFSYVAHRHRSAYTISPPDEVFEKSLRLGFITNITALNARYHNLVASRPELISIEKIAEIFVESQKGKLFEGKRHA